MLIAVAPSRKASTMRERRSPLPNVVWISCAAIVASILGAPATAHADTVVLKGGKKITGVIVSQNDDEWVVINPWNSPIPEMTWEIPDKSRIPRDKVEEVILSDLDPRTEFRRRASTPNVSADEHVLLAAMAKENKWKDEIEEHLILALTIDPSHEGALEAFGRRKWETYLTRNKQQSEEVRAAERAYLELRDPGEAKEAASRLDDAGSERDLAYMERARRSAAIPKGRRDKVPMTLNSREAPGATYAIYVPESYDPLTPTGLVVALHGGGAGGKDETLVTGSGESALNFYMDVARQWGLIVVCPTAIVAPWNKPGNRPVIDGVVSEMNLLYNVDPRRVYLTGHSMGGFGTWYWSVQKEDTWAAVSPCAGGGGRAAIPKIQQSGLPIYIYHGTDDNIVSVASDRDCARALLGDGKSRRGGPDFVYTELDKVGHGFPTSARHDIFRWFMGRWREGRQVGRSSFDAKVTREEIEAFGDPSSLKDEADDSIKSLIADLARGGGAAAQAAEAFRGLQGKAVGEAVKELGNLLRSKKSNADVRTQAARALGVLGATDGLAPLTRCADDEDFRVVDAATAALGAIGGEDARPGLAAMARALGRWYTESYQGGGIAHTEYDVRLNSFVGLLDAIAKVGDAETFHDLIRREIVEPVFLTDGRETVWGDDDSRFKNVSKDARKRLVRALGACMKANGDESGDALLRRVAERWAHEPGLVAEIERALERT